MTSTTRPTVGYMWDCPSCGQRVETFTKPPRFDEGYLTKDHWFKAADRLTAIIESRMSSDVAWLQDDGKTIIRLNPEEAAYHLTHLYRTGDVVSGLPPLDEEASR